MITGVRQENKTTLDVGVQILIDVLLLAEESPRVMHTCTTVRIFQETMHPTVRLEHSTIPEVAATETEQDAIKGDGDEPTSRRHGNRRKTRNDSEWINDNGPGIGDADVRR